MIKGMTIVNMLVIGKSAKAILPKTSNKTLANPNNLEKTGINFVNIGVIFEKIPVTFEKTGVIFENIGLIFPNGFFALETNLLAPLVIFFNLLIFFEEFEATWSSFFDPNFLNLLKIFFDFKEILFPIFEYLI